jgi:hypothetical protein
MREVYFSETEINGFLLAFEKKYGFATEEFLCNHSIRTQIPEDDIFEWEALAAHSRELKKLEEELRRDYLAKLTGPLSGTPQTLTFEDQIALAA